MMMVLRRCRYLLIVLLWLAAPGAAATLDDYQKRLEIVRLDVIALRRLEDEGPGLADMRRRKLDDIQASLPAGETVEWPGGSAQTNNQWLHDSISTYLDERDTEQRKAVLFAVEERFTAIAETIAELRRAEAADRTKDDDKQKLAEILRREEYQKAAVKEESLFQRWYRAFMKWLAESFPTAPETPNAPSGLGSLKFFLQLLILGIVIGLVAFLLYKFGPSAVRRFGWRTKEKKRDRVILGERVGADETAENLFGEAERLAREGRLRDAIRKGYIAALCELSDRNIVRLARHKTNRDYLRDLRKTRERVFENMSGLTGTYERNWYGLRASQPADWEDFRERYTRTISDI